MNTIGTLLFTTYYSVTGVQILSLHLYVKLSMPHHMLWLLTLIM